MAFNDIEINLGPKSSSRECFSICHWNSNSIFFFLIWIYGRVNSHYKAWSYKKNNRLKHAGNLLRKNLLIKRSVNSRPKAIIGQRKAFSRQRISEPSRARKETVDIEILVTSRNGA